MLRQPIWTQRQLNELKRLYESGVPFPTIAETLNRSASAIRTRAQINQFRRPKRLGRSDIIALQARAANLGLDEAALPSNPTALRILVCLVNTGVSSKLALDKACSVGSCARNKALRSLSELGLVLGDDFCSPAEVILKRRAYRSRPEPVMAEPDQIRMGVLPTMTKLHSELDAWLPVSGTQKRMVETYRAFIVRQLENAQSGDVSPADFYSIFYSLNRK